MKIIFLKTIPGTARAGEVKDVSDGYAQNFLFKQGVAKPATKSSVDVLNAQKAHEQKAKKQENKKAKKTASGLSGQTVHIKAKANKQGVLYAAVHADQVARAIQEQYKISASIKTMSPADIKDVGRHKITLELTPSGSVELNLQVESA